MNYDGRECFVIRSAHNFITSAEAMCLLLFCTFICFTHSEPGVWELVKTDSRLKYEGAALAVYNDTSSSSIVYYIGGNSSESEYNTQFLKITGHFSNCTNLTVPTGWTGSSYCTLTPVKNGLLLVGGYKNGTISSKVYLYSFFSTTWDTKERVLPNNLTLYKHCTAATPGGEYAIIYGGMKNTTKQNINTYISLCLPFSLTISK